MAYVMGIDINSNSIKAVVYDERGSAVASGLQPTPLTYDNKAQPSWCVWDPKRIWGNVVYAISEATGKTEHPEEIQALSVTGFGMDGLPLRRDGLPLYPMISWHCPRTIPQYEAFLRKVGEENIFRRTGKRAMAIDSIYRMMWMRENEEAAFQTTDKWLSIVDYINYMLCGVKATDYSMAACTSAFDQRGHAWCEDLLREAGIPLSIFPKAYPAGKVLGTLSPVAAQETGLSSKTRVVLGGHDYMCAAFAAGAMDGSTLLDMTGGWEMLLLATDKAELSDELYDSGYYLEGHVIKDKCCYVGSAVSGDMTEWMKKTLCAEERVIAEAQDENIWDIISDACSRAGIGSGGCMFLPHFSGAGAPFRDPNSMGAFLGLHHPIRKRDMMRAVFEGLDYQFRAMLEAFQACRLGTPRRIIATGKAAHNVFWMQNKADVSGLALEVPDIEEPAALGAAMLAGLGVGLYSSEREAADAVRKGLSVYEPDEQAHRKYDDYYQNIYCKLYRSLAEVNGELSRRFRR